jgi:hypothetical protein
MTRLCIIVAALALIARARVAIVPGWVVPLPVLLTAALVVVCAAVVALHMRPVTVMPEPTGEAGS